MPKLEPYSPLWWCDRLYKQIVDRQPSIERFSAYYCGDHPLPWLPNQIQDMAIRILKMTRTNYMGLVVDATTERQEVLGFRLGTSPDADKEAYRVWQANNLDAASSVAFQQAAICGTVYWLVAPNPDDPKTPRITIEHPSQMVVEYAPGNVRVRDAALKMWFDDRLGMTLATLYLPDYIYKFQGKKDAKPEKWEPRQVEGEEFPAENPLGVVPVIEMRNNPQTIFRDRNLVFAGVSEIADVTDIQDRVNKTIADRLITQDFGAFPQMWATGWAEDDDEEDRAAVYDAQQAAGTGQEVGTPHPVQQVNFGRDRIVVATDPGVRFGQWAAAPMDPYSHAKSEDVQDIAARTRTPSQYLLAEMVNISGDALQAAESGLASKVRQRNRSHSDPLEETIGLALRTAGDTRDMSSAATIWRDPEFRTLGQLTDAVIKKHQSGLISWEQAMEDLGYTPDQINRNRGLIRKELLEKATLASLTAQIEQPVVQDAVVSNPADEVGIPKSERPPNGDVRTSN